MMLVLATSGIAGAQASRDSLPQPAIGVLLPGDMLMVRVFGEEEYSGDFLINSNGVVQIPGVGLIQAAGLNPNEMYTRIRDALLEAGVANPSISVWPQVRVSVVGEVQNPGVKPVEPGTNLITMLAAVGGPTEKADLKKARVIRGGESYPVNLERALEGDATGRLMLFSNDVLVVPPRRGLTRENMTLLLGALTALLSLANVIISSR